MGREKTDGSAICSKKKSEENEKWNTGDEELAVVVAGAGWGESAQVVIDCQDADLSISFHLSIYLFTCL